MGLLSEKELRCDYQYILVNIGNGNCRADICCEPKINIFLRSGCTDVTYVEIALREILANMIANGDNLPERTLPKPSDNPLCALVDLKESHAYRNPADSETVASFMIAAIKEKVPDKKDAEELIESVFNYVKYYHLTHKD